jgi:hypothetical protein
LRIGRVRIRRVVALTVVALQLAAVVIGIHWTVRNLGSFPHYGDTTEYLWRAETLQVDEYRAIAYPALLSLVGRLPGAPEEWSRFRWEPSPELGIYPCAAPSVLVAAQVGQIAFGALAVAYAVFVLFGRRLGIQLAPGAAAGVLLGCLVLFDPLVAHFNLTILPDGPTLSALLLYTAAWVHLATRRSSAWVPLILLLVGHLLAAGFRAEKNALLVASSLSTALLWLVYARRLPEELRRQIRTRALVAIGLTGLAAATVFQVHQNRQQAEMDRWPLRTTMIHQRVLFGNMLAVYDQLPPDVRGRLSREDAAIYDERIHNVWKVTNRIAPVPKDRDEFTSLAARVVLRERWGRILADIASDTTENLLATVSFYGRLGVRQMGSEPLGPAFEWVGWTYGRLIAHTPALSKRLVVVSAVALLAALLAAAVHGLRTLTRGARRVVSRETKLAAIPVAVVIGVNSVAFAATSDLVHIRYALISHAFLILAAHGLALLWALRVGLQATGSRFSRKPDPS